MKISIVKSPAAENSILSLISPLSSITTKNVKLVTMAIIIVFYLCLGAAAVIVILSSSSLLLQLLLPQ